jgi:hypothetical protein
MTLRTSCGAALLAAAVACASGCGSGFTNYPPRVLAPNELTLRYENEFQVWAPDGMVARGVRYDGLAEYVRCVPDAHRHAVEAESAGSAAVGMTVAGGVLAVGGLAGLGGLAFKDKDPAVMAAFFTAGISAEVIGLVLAAVGRAKKTDANGHAVDAVNYYNDAVGSEGRGCGPGPGRR